MSQAEEKQIQLSRQLKECLIEAAESTSIHGIPNISRTKHTSIRILWLIVCLAISLVCILSIRSQYQRFLDYPVSTVNKLIYENQVDFPNVAVCNINPFVTDNSVQYLLAYIKNQNITADNPLNLTEVELINDILRKNNAFLRKLLTELRRLDNKTLKTFGLSPQKTFLSCQFLNVDCNLTDFEWLFDFDYGNCHIFNPREKKVRLAGKKNMLQVDIFSGIENSMPNFYDGNGFKLVIFSSNEDIEYSAKLEKISVATGSELTIVLNRFVHQKLESPYSDCRIDNNNHHKFKSEFINDRATRNIKYKQVNCKTYYLEQEVISMCKCRINKKFLPDVESPSDVKWCETKKEVTCATKLSNDFLYEDLGSKFDNDCPLECERSYYGYTMSVNSFPSTNYVRNLMRTNELFANLSLSEVSKGVSRVNIYFENLAYELIEETATFTELDLLANVGGILGLGLGMSLLSFIEVVEMCLCMFMLTFKWLKRVYFKI